MHRKKLPYMPIHSSKIPFLTTVNFFQQNNKSKILGKLLCEGVNKYSLLPTSIFFHATQEKKFAAQVF